MSDLNEKNQNEGRELLTSKLLKFNEPFYILTYADVIELLYFMFQTGYIHADDHERIHELIWDWKILLDNVKSGWRPDTLKMLVQEVRDAKKVVSS